jgi:hypothetical protein
MATQHLPDPPDDDPLDLRDLAASHQVVMTSVGRLHMRKLSSLGPLDRVRVSVLFERVTRRAGQLDESLRRGEPPDGDPSLESLARTMLQDEDDLLRLVVPDITDDQLEGLPAPERAGLLAVFFGASGERAREAVAKATATLMPLAETPRAGAKRSRASSGSTAATRRRG